MDIHNRRERARKVAIGLVLANLFLFLIKYIPTLVYPSISVKADAFNSLGDFGYSALVLLGFEILFRPRDKTHPHGHERFEPFISLIVAIAIGITGLLVVTDAIQSLFEPTYSFSYLFVIALLASCIVKYLLSIHLEKKSKEIGSTALLSSSKDAKADVLASSAALVGVLGARGGFIYLDTIIGLIVSVWIFKTAFSIGKENFRYLTGATAPEKIIDQIKDILNRRESIISYHDLEAHYVGPEVHVSLSIHLSEELSFNKVHEIEEELKKKLESIKGVDTVYLHLEPRGSK